MNIRLNEKLFFVLTIFLLCAVNFTSIAMSKNDITNKFSKSHIISDDNTIDSFSSYYFTHTVFAGIATSQNCKPCDDWNENLYDLYMSGEYDFEYVEIIEFDHDGKILNLKANEWSENFDIGSYPTSIFDRDFDRIIGNYPEQLSDTIENCGERTVYDISSTLNIFWLDNGQLQIDITIQNNEPNTYVGHIRCFVTEIISRYDTYYGDPYHFGFLDYAYDDNIQIESGNSHMDSVIWDGNEHEDEHGDDFGDIDPDNIQLVLIVYNNNNDFIDETNVARISGNNPPDAPMISGQTKGNTKEEYEYKFTTNDFNNDNIFYYVEWGDGTLEEWIGPYESGEELIISHSWDEDGIYTIKAKAKDIHDAESLWNTLDIEMPINKKSTYFLILKYINNLTNVVPILKQLIWFALNL